MEIINIADAKAQLSKLVEDALAGKEVIIGKRNKPLVRLTALISGQKTTRKGGQWRGKIAIADDFETLPEDISDAFQGNRP